MSSTMKVSPDSVPSLSAISSVSSATDRVVRELFPGPINVSTCYEIELDDNVRNQPRGLDRGSRCSPDATVSLGEQVHNVPKKQGISLLPNQIGEFHNGSEINIHSDSCYVLDVFKIHRELELSESTSMSHSANDAVTEVTSNIDPLILCERKIDSLEREINTLKSIIEVDNETILNLKAELSAVYEISSEQKRIDQGTIDHLQKVIESLTDENNCITNTKEVEQLRLERELFASQIIESESEIRETRGIILEMAEKLADVQSKSDIEATYFDETFDNIQLKEEVRSLAEKICHIESNLKQGYYCQCYPNADHRSHSVRKRDKNEFYDTVMLDEYCSNDDSSLLEPHGLVDEDKDNNLSNIEVTLDGSIVSASGMSEIPSDDKVTPKISDEYLGPPVQQKPEVVSPRSCGFCDCFRIVEKESEL